MKILTWQRVLQSTKNLH